jgi:hypothetical protein
VQEDAPAGAHVLRGGQAHVREPVGSDGGSIEKLREILGHSTVLATERYAHLKPELFQEADMLRADVSLAVTN